MFVMLLPSFSAIFFNLVFVSSENLKLKGDCFMLNIFWDKDNVLYKKIQINFYMYCKCIIFVYKN
nr:MAG TPA: hypothetical protein [Caudoviricetes sp.]DAY29462.1 MAG TPA: hypothetical protein [Caudoviricetes sp.]